MTRHRVIQWATGSIGQAAIRACAERDDLELVGAYVSSAAKVGRDVGVIAGIEPIGVTATNDIDALLALDADCVVYTPMHASVPELCRILASGKDVVTICGWLAPGAVEAEELAAVEAACAVGGSTLYGTGVHPGYLAETTVWNLARLSQRIDRIGFHESGDLSRHPSADMLTLLGLGRPPDELGPDGMGADIDGLMAQGIAALAHGLGVTVDDVRADQEAAVSTVELDVAAGHVPAGHVGGRRWRWTGMAGGTPRIEYTMTYWLTPELQPRWDLPGTKYLIEIEGAPGLRCAIDALDGEGGAVGREWAVMAALNAVAEVGDAEPGVRTHLDLPLAVPRALTAHWHPKSLDGIR